MKAIRVAHLSDPHFGTVRPELEGALVASLALAKPDLVVVTGDITQRAHRQQFLAARKFWKKLAPVPVHMVPGNHDIPLFDVLKRVFDPYHGFEKHLGLKREARVALGAVELITLDSTSRWRHVQGGFTGAQLEEKVPKLAPEQEDGLRILAFHHPLDCVNPTDEKNLARGVAEWLPLLEERRVDIVLGGHIHDPHFALSTDRYPAARRPLLLVTAGTCLSWRTRSYASNSFHLLELEPGKEAQVRLTQMNLNAAGAFAPARSALFTRLAGGWCRRA